MFCFHLFLSCFLFFVGRCARKTEVALWPHLFAVVGSPRALFTECLSMKDLETAATYLLILQNLEPPSIAQNHATLLLDAALDTCSWELAKELSRFLRTIGTYSRSVFFLIMFKDFWAQHVFLFSHFLRSGRIVRDVATSNSVRPLRDLAPVPAHQQIRARGRDFTAPWNTAGNHYI